MTFEQAADLSTFLHYTLVWGGCTAVLLSSYKNFINLIIKIYVMFFSWGALCYMVGGCPLTLTENYISTQIYGKPFYPGYTFTGSDFYYLIHSQNFYLPLILGAVVLIHERYAKTYSSGTDTGPTRA